MKKENGVKKGKLISHVSEVLDRFWSLIIDHEDFDGSTRVIYLNLRLTFKRSSFLDEQINRLTHVHDLSSYGLKISLA